MTLTVSSIVNETVCALVLGPAPTYQRHHKLPFLICHTRLDESSSTTTHYYGSVCCVCCDEVSSEADARGNDDVTVWIRVAHVLVRNYPDNHPALLLRAPARRLHHSTQPTCHSYRAPSSYLGTNLFCRIIGGLWTVISV